MARPLKVQCSNCMGFIRLDLDAGTATVTIPASGRGSLRTAEQVITRDVVDEGGLYAWEAPCCPDYWDSLDKDAVEVQDTWQR